MLVRSLTLSHRAVPRPALHATSARTDRARRDEPDADHHASPRTERGPSGLQHVQEQEGPLREGGPGALTYAGAVVAFAARIGAGRPGHARSFAGSAPSGVADPP